MDVLGSNMNKNELLDILAYLLWKEETAYELSFSHINLCKKIYKEVMSLLKGDTEQWQNEPPHRHFCTFHLECRDLGNLVFQEKRLEMIEQRLKEFVP